MSSKSTTTTRFWQGKKVFILAIIIAGILAGALTAKELRNDQERETFEILRRDSHQFFEIVEDELDNLELMVRALKSFFDASENVTVDEFATFTEPFLSQHFYVQALEWIPEVKADQREQFEVEARKNGFEGFGLTVRGPDGRMLPAPEKDVYYPVYYLEPFAGNEQALGYDLSSSPLRKKFLWQARDNGKVSATASLALVKGNMQRRGVSIIAPVYERSQPIFLPSVRRDSLKGFVLGIFSVSDLIERAPGLEVLKKYGQVWVFDETDAPEQPPELLYRSDEQAQPFSYERALKDWRIYSRTLQVADRQWRVFTNSTACRYSFFEHATPGLVGSAVFIFFLTIAFMFKQQMDRSHLIEEEVERQTKELAASRAKLQNIFENSTSIFYTHTPDHVLTFISPQCNELLGYREEEMNRQWTEMVSDHPLNEIGLEVTEKAIKTGQRQPPYELEFVRKDGTKVMVEIREFPRVENGQTVEIIGSLTEITERKKMEREQHELVRQIYQSQKMESIGTMVSGTAHNFNNILATMHGYIEMAMTDMDPASQEVQDLKGALVEIDNAKALIRGMLDLSRTSETKAEQFEIVGLLKQTVAIFRPSVRGTVKISEIFNIDHGVAFGDSVQIQQVLLNILINASHAITHLQGEIDIELSRVFADADFIKSRPNLKKGYHYKISIKDNGCGMEQSVVDRIFEPFFTTKEVGEGTGLGLSTAYGVITSHNGDIIVDSAPGEGTVFDVYLPCDSSEEF